MFDHSGDSIVQIQANSFWPFDADFSIIGPRYRDLRFDAATAVSQRNVGSIRILMAFISTVLVSSDLEHTIRIQRPGQQPFKQISLLEHPIFPLF